MTRSAHACVFVFVAVSCLAPSAHAQRGAIGNRGFVLVNGSYQMGGTDFERVATMRANAEDSSFTRDYDVKGGPLFDVGGGMWLHRRFGVGLGVTRFSGSTPSALSGAVPHPFFFNRPRTVASDVSGLTREELAVHAQIQAMAPVGRHVQVMAFGGPSFFRVKQSVVNAFTWTENYPYDAATFSSATIVRGFVDRIQRRSGCRVLFLAAARCGWHHSVLASGRRR
jgi:hypothetical protein